MANRTVISVAGLLGRPVIHKGGQEAGRLIDLVFRWDSGEPYPPLSGILVSVGRRTVWIGGSDVDRVEVDHVKLRTARVDLRDYVGRPGEVAIAKEVLDHQLVDVSGARVVRASDLYVALVTGTTRLVGVDVGYASLIRRLGPARFRSRASTGAVLDWAGIQSFGAGTAGGKGLKLGTSRHDMKLKRLHPSQLADVLEDLGRTERQELLSSLSPEHAADALEEMQPEEVETILREATPIEAAKYLSNMEPDEAADALRDVDAPLREDLLAKMSARSAEQVEEVLSHDEDEAGGFMSTAFVKANGSDLVGSVRKKIAGLSGGHHGLESVAVIGPSGVLVGDVAVIDMFLADPDAKMETLVSPVAPVTVGPDAEVEEVAEVLTQSRRSSVLVVNEQNQPVGRILADDLIDALLPERGKFHFPRVLS